MMRRLRYDLEYSPVRYPADCDRICRVLGSYGIVVSLHDAERMWGEYSESLCAGWLILPESDEEIFETLTIPVSEDDEED